MIEDCVNVGDAEREGLEKLEQGPRDYFAGGAEDEGTLRENVAAWGHWRVRPRVLNGVRGVSTAAEVLGKPVETPVLVAPVVYQRMAHPDGERGMAAGAAAAGTVMCLSTLSTIRPAEVAAAAPGGRRWFQLYAFKDAVVTRALMEEAIDAGFEAVVVTPDAPPGGNRERDRRNRFTLPQDLGTPSLSAAVGGGKALTIEETFALPAGPPSGASRRPAVTASPASSGSSARSSGSPSRSAAARLRHSCHERTCGGRPPRPYIRSE